MWEDAKQLVSDNEKHSQVVGGAEGARDSGGGAGQVSGGDVSREVSRDDEAPDALLRLALVEVARQRYVRVHVTA